MGFLFDTHVHSQLGTTGNYSAIPDIHTLQFTVTHALEFPVFTSRILAMDLSQSHSHFRSHMKSVFHSGIPFLSLFSTQFNSSTPKLISPEADVVKLDSSVLDYWSVLLTRLLNTAL
jgi:hypothetical protein